MNRRRFLKIARVGFLGFGSSPSQEPDSAIAVCRGSEGTRLGRRLKVDVLVVVPSAGLATITRLEAKDTPIGLPERICADSQTAT